MKTIFFKAILLLSFAFTLAFCKPSPPSNAPDKKAVNESTSPLLSQSTTEPLDTNRYHHYPWLTTYEAKDMLINQVPVPEGFERILVQQNSFADWLRHLPLKAAESPVRYFDGRLKPSQNVHHRVVNIDTGKRDLQQCADAVMRLKAEYHYSKADYGPIHFNFTSGDRVAFDDWRKGRKPKIVGNKVTFTALAENSDDSYTNFRKYMTQIFNYAGTASLSKEMKSIAVEEMQIGDVFIQGGFPGHAVIVVDMAEHESGQRLFLLAQSYMPAQDLHLLKNKGDSALNPWYTINFGNELESPEWTFTNRDLKRFKE